MVTREREIEAKFDVTPEFALPDLAGLPGTASTSPPSTVELAATYFDTADLRLARRGITVRRRTGGADAGWHVKLPAGQGKAAEQGNAATGRDELRWPLETARSAPPEVLTELTVYLRGARLAPVATVTTTRTVHNLLAKDGTVLAEVSDDHVTAVDLRGEPTAATATTWREIEVELKGGKPALLDVTAGRLRAAGAVPSSAGSKLARVLGVERTKAPVPDARTAGGVVLGYLEEQAGQLIGQDPAVRADAEDAVHKMRVAARRLRSALATYRSLFDRRRTDPIRDELRWLGAELGAPRDAEVIRAHLLRTVRDEPADLVLGPVLADLDRRLSERHDAAHAEAVAALDSERYFELLDDLESLLADPPLTTPAGGKAAKVLPGLVRRTWRRTERLLPAIETATTSEAHDNALHDLRKAAKRARYAGESLTGRFGKPAKNFAKAMESVQELLGEHQDSVVVRHELLALAAAAHRTGASTFTYGRLHAREQARAARVEAAFPAAWEQAADPELRTWF